MEKNKLQLFSETPAFPMVDSNTGAHQCGLTIREYFAAMAMQGLLSNYVANNDSVNDNYPFVQEKAVICADALIKELSKPLNHDTQSNH